MDGDAPVVREALGDALGDGIEMLIDVHAIGRRGPGGDTTRPAARVGEQRRGWRRVEIVEIEIEVPGIDQVQFRRLAVIQDGL